MKRFTFGLERLLWLRSQFEKDEARALRLAKLEEEERRAALERAESRLGEFGAQIVDASERTATAGTLHVMGMTIQAAARDLDAAAESHRESVEGVAGAERRFDVKRQERRVVEKLRQHREAEWKEEESRVEQREMDGLARRPRIEGEEAA
jgi:flagellar export protein FliJ